MKNKNVFWGIFFIVAAVVVLVLQLGGGLPISLFGLVFSALLASIIVKSAPTLNFGGMLFPLGLLYWVWEKPLELPHVSFWILMMTAALGSIGLSILFSGVRRDLKARRYADYHHYGYVAEGSYTGEGYTPEGNFEQAVEVNMSGDENHPVANVRLGASSKYLHSDCLETGWFTCSLGAMEVYFDQAVLSPYGADITVDCSLGAISLYIPRGWRVEENVTASLGGVDHAHRGSFTPAPDAPVLRIHGNVSLAGLEIKYV